MEQYSVLFSTLIIISSSKVFSHNPQIVSWFWNSNESSLLSVTFVLCYICIVPKNVAELVNETLLNCEISTQVKTIEQNFFCDVFVSCLHEENT